MRFWRRLTLAWKAAATPDYVLDADLPGFWTDADARTLAGYFRSDSGRKLKQILRNYQIHAANEAINLRMTRSHARGIRSTVEMLERYLPNPMGEADEEQAERTPAETAFMEQLGV